MQAREQDINFFSSKANTWRILFSSILVPMVIRIRVVRIGVADRVVVRIVVVISCVVVLSAVTYSVISWREAVS